MPEMNSKQEALLATDRTAVRYQRQAQEVETDIRNALKPYEVCPAQELDNALVAQIRMQVQARLRSMVMDGEMAMGEMEIHGHLLDVHFKIASEDNNQRITIDLKTVLKGKPIKLTSDQWDDVADIFEQSAYMARDSKETHSVAACDYAAKRLDRMAMWATGRAMEARGKEAARGDRG